jgi:hypothetical protein
MIVLGYFDHPARAQCVEIGRGLAFWKATLGRKFLEWLVAKIADIVDDEPCCVKDTYVITVDKVKDE